MTLRVVNEGLLALLATRNSVHLVMMQHEDDRFVSFAQNRGILFVEKIEAKKNVSKRVENHRFCSENRF